MTVLPLPGVGRSWVLPVALRDHHAGISLGQTWEDVAGQKQYFSGEKNPL